MTIDRVTHMWVLAAMVSLVVMSGCDSVQMKGTPLYTGEYSRPQAPPEERVNLWPLAYYHEPALSVLWPVGEWTEDHRALRPLYSVYKLDKERHAHNVLFPLSHFDFDEKLHWILPFVWGGTDGKEHAALSPIVWWERNKYFVLFPVFWYAPKDYVSLFPLFIRNRMSGGHDTHILWPIVRWKNTTKEKGWRVWPLVGSYTKGDKRRRYLLWPLCHENRNDAKKSVSRVVLPLYFSKHQESQGWDFVLPIFWRSYKPNVSTMLTPLYSSGHDKKDRWQLLFPFFYRSRSEKHQTFVTPIIGHAKSPSHDTWSVIPLVSWFTRDRDKRDLWIVGPLAHFAWGGGRHKSHVGPVYYYSSESGTLWTPIAGGNLSKDKGFFNLLGVVYHQRWWKGEQWSWSAVLWAISAWDRNHSKGSRFWPLYSHERRKNDGRKNGFVLWPLVNYRFNPKKTKFSIFGLMDYRRSEVVRGKKDDIETRYSTKSLSSLLLYNKKSRLTKEVNVSDGSETIVLDDKRNAFFPLWYNKVIQEKGSTKSDFNIFGWLYDYRRRIAPAKEDVPEEDYTRHRVLWRLYHRERRKKHTATDIFPFITSDRNQETGFRKMSFAWRFFRYERGQDGSKKVDLLFLPVFRSSRARLMRVGGG